MHDYWKDNRGNDEVGELLQASQHISIYVYSVLLGARMGQTWAHFYIRWYLN